MPPEERPEEPKQTGREPLSPAKRKRLDALLVHARKRNTGDRPDHDYAAKLLTECVLGDPGNINYVKEYVDTLQKKYDNNRSGSSFAQFKELGARSALKKAVAREDWGEVVENGLKVLVVNPWDVPTLTGLAMAAKKQAHFEVELFYLKAALVASPKDGGVNRLCAIALAERGDYDQAIICWHRVEQADPKDEEAKRSIAYLHDKKMRRQAGAEDTGELPKHAGSGPDASQEVLSPEKRLLQKIEQEPDKLEHYFGLSQVYVNAERFAEAVRVLTEAYRRSGKDSDVREKLEDAQIRRLRQKIAQAAEPEQKKRLREEYYQKELEVWQNRCRRFPGKLDFRYQLGYRYYLTGRYKEAIRELQTARNEPNRRGVCLLALGMCFERIKQYRLSMKHYEDAIAEIPDRDAENKKLALYSAGRLAMATREVHTAEKHLTTLAGMDFSYKKVAELLDKIAQFHQNKGLGEDQNGLPEEELPPEDEDSDAES